VTIVPPSGYAEEMQLLRGRLPMRPYPRCCCLLPGSAPSAGAPFLPLLSAPLPGLHLPLPCALSGLLAATAPAVVCDKKK